MSGANRKRGAVLPAGAMLRNFRDKLRALRHRGAGDSPARTPSNIPRRPQRLRTPGRFRRGQLESGSPGGAASGTADAARASPGPPRMPRPAFSPRTPVAVAADNSEPPSDGTEAVSSIPSTNISNDGFLDDEVPVEVTRRPAADRAREGLRAALRQESVPAAATLVASPDPSRRLSLEPGVEPRSGGTTANGTPAPPAPSPAGTPAAQPHSFGSASAPSRRRSALWAAARPNSAVAAAREACTAPSPVARVAAAGILADAAHAHAAEIDPALTALRAAVGSVRAEAAALPTARAPRFERLLFASDPRFGSGGPPSTAAPSARTGEPDVSFRDLGWCERIWDIEALLAEHRLDAAVAGVEELRSDDEFSSATPATQSHLDDLCGQLADRLVALPVESADAAAACAQHLSRLGRPETGARVVLRTAERLLQSKLTRLALSAKLDLPRHVHLVLRLALAQLCAAHAALSELPLPAAAKAGTFVGWATSQTDAMYRQFVRSKLTFARGLDGGALLRIAAAIQGAAAVSPAALRRTASLGGAPLPSADPKDPARAPAAVFRARLLAAARAHLASVARDLRASLLRAASSARADAAHVRARERGPPRMAAALARDVDAAAAALSPVLREVPALDDGAVDGAIAHALLVYTAGLCRAVRNDARTAGSEHGQPPAVREATGFLAKAVSDAIRKHALPAPAARRAAALIVHGGSDDAVLAVVEQAKKAAAGQADPAHGRLSEGDAAVAAEAVENAAGEADVREQARQMLAQQRRVAAAAASPPVAVA